MDPYVYPGTNILKNLRDIRDSKNLAEFEAEVTAERVKELENNPIAGLFDATHLKAIHGYVFQDVYCWAGLARISHRLTGQAHDRPTTTSLHLLAVLNGL